MTRLTVNPYMRQVGSEIENIISGARIDVATDAGVQLQSIIDTGRFSIDAASISSKHRSELEATGFLLPATENIFALSNLRYISLETNSICNQRCFFCPVSENPLPLREMGLEMIEELARQASGFENFVAFFLNHYNEPIVDKRSPAIIDKLRRYDHKIAVNTNGSIGLEKLDGVLPRHSIDLLTVNLHTIDAQQYRDERGRDHLQAVLRNVEGYRTAEIAKVMRVVVLGFDDAKHDANHSAIVDYFDGTGMEIMRHGLSDRCGTISIPAVDTPETGPKVLVGCEQTGSRVLEHLHILADGKAIICCEDYNSEEVVGDAHRQSLKEILEGEPMQALRRTIYGFDEASADFICSRCEYARCGSRLRRLD